VGIRFLVKPKPQIPYQAFLLADYKMGIHLKLTFAYCPPEEHICSHRPPPPIHALCSSAIAKPPNKTRMRGQKTHPKESKKSTYLVARICSDNDNMYITPCGSQCGDQIFKFNISYRCLNKHAFWQVAKGESTHLDLPKSIMSSRVTYMFPKISSKPHMAEP